MYVIGLKPYYECVKMAFEQPETLGDNIYQLPVDEQPVTDHDTQIINTVFRKERSSIQALASELKEPLIIGILFILLSSSKSDDLVKKVIPYANNSHVGLIIIKTLVFMLLKLLQMIPSLGRF